MGGTEDGTAADGLALMRLAFGAMATHTVGAAVRMNVVGALGDGGSVAEAAGRLGVPEHTLLRLLRALAALGIAAEPEPGRFVPTAAGRLLHPDHPAGAHAFVRMFTDPVMLGAWPHLESSLRTGATTFDDVFGVPFFTHLAGEPELSGLFNASMRAATARMTGELATGVDFARFDTVVDVGGGDGTLLTAVLDAHPGTRGIVYDSAEGAAQAPARIRDAGLESRCTVETGDFFARVPTGGDAYLLKSIVHDWDDDRAATILRHCRDALPAHGRVLVVEPVLPDTVPDGEWAGRYLSDLNMLVNVGGRERTAEDFGALAAAAGLTVTGIVALPPETGFCVVEAAPA